MAKHRLDLESHPRFQKNEWRIQRLCWFIWILVLVAAFTGLLGNGPLSRHTIESPDGSLRISYDRFSRHHRPSVMDVDVVRSTGRNSQNQPEAKSLSRLNESDGQEFPAIRLHIDQLLLDAIQVRAIQPEPIETVLRQDGAQFLFRQESQVESTRIKIFFEHEDFGKVAGAIRLEEGPPVTVEQFVYP